MDNKTAVAIKWRNRAFRKNRKQNPAYHFIKAVLQKLPPKAASRKDGLDEFQYYIFTSRRCSKHSVLMRMQTFAVKLSKVKLDTDNRFIALQNSTPNETSRCNDNAELCVSKPGDMNYLSNYAGKGRHRITIQLQNETKRNDQIRNVVKVRYFRASEAAWRIFEMRNVDKQSWVICLDFHLQRNQTLDVQKEAERTASVDGIPGPAQQNRTTRMKFT